MPSLTERLRAMLAEAGGEREQLEAQRSELMAERDSRIDAIRTEYAAKLAAIDADLATAKRIERALEPPERKAKEPAATPGRKRKPVKWRPRPENVRAILNAVESGRETISEIEAAVDLTRSGVDNAMASLREDNLIRLAGSKTVEGTNAKARIYRLTPAGTEYLNEQREPVSNGAPA